MNDTQKIQAQCLAAMLSNPSLVRWADSETAKEGRITLDNYDEREALIFKAFQFAEQFIHGRGLRQSA